MTEAPIIDPSLVNAAAIAAAYGVDAAVGLSADEAAHRLDRDGPNELRGKPRVPTWRRILGQFRDPLIYLLLGAIVVSLIGWLVEGAEGWPIDAVVIAAIVLLNGLLHERESHDELGPVAQPFAAALNDSVVHLDKVLHER